MKIELDSVLKNVDGTDAVDVLSDGTVNAQTVRLGLIAALLTDITGDGRPVPGGEKIRRYELWLRLKDAGAVVELTAADAAFLQSCVLIFPTLVAGQLTHILDGTKH